MNTDNTPRVATVYHPGETLKEKIQELGFGVKDFSARVSLPENTINDVINGRENITQELALSLEAATQIPAHFWMNRQRMYDEYESRTRQGCLQEIEHF